MTEPYRVQRRDIDGTASFEIWDTRNQWAFRPLMTFSDAEGEGPGRAEKDAERIAGKLNAMEEA
jgi:hypothetical protein